MSVCVCSYLLLVSQYEAVSFCDAVFASYVLLPLQQTHSVLLRKMVWGEHVSVLQSLSIPANQVTVLSVIVTGTGDDDDDDDAQICKARPK